MVRYVLQDQSAIYKYGGNYTSGNLAGGLKCTAYRVVSINIQQLDGHGGIQLSSMIEWHENLMQISAWLQVLSVFPNVRFP